MACVLRLTAGDSSSIDRFGARYVDYHTGGEEGWKKDVLSYGCSDPGDCGEAARDLRLQEISVRPPRGSP